MSVLRNLMNYIGDDMFKIEFYDEKFKQSFNPMVKLEVVASGFRFLEGPAWHHKTETLYFSDIMGNGIYKYMDDEISLFRENSYLANGNTFNRWVSWLPVNMVRAECP